MIDPQEPEVYLVELRTPDGELVDSYQTTFPAYEEGATS